MYFNYIEALKNLRRRQERENPLLEQAGVSEEDIIDLFRFERRMLDHDAQFYLSLDDYISIETPLTVEQKYYLGTMDEIENERLHAALAKLNTEERELILLHIVDGVPLKLLATLLGKSYENVKKTYWRTIQRLKNIF